VIGNAHYIAVAFQRAIAPPRIILSGRYQLLPVCIAKWRSRIELRRFLVRFARLQARMPFICRGPDPAKRLWHGRPIWGTICAVKILALSDQVVDRVYTLVSQGHFAGVDLILGCGDLPYNYLEYLVSALNVPMFYVPGNHDPVYNPRLPSANAEGGANLDLRQACSKGLLLAGLGGCNRYRPDGVNQYTQSEALLRAVLLMPGLLLNRMRYGRTLDILISHSPAYGIHDEAEQAHRGLKAINWILAWAKPRYHLHGHTHFFRNNLEASVSQRGATTVMNVYPYKLIEI
jgi:Icc-related predicted phosphoesterase